MQKYTSIPLSELPPYQPVYLGQFHASEPYASVPTASSSDIPLPSPNKSDKIKPTEDTLPLPFAVPHQTRWHMSLKRISVISQKTVAWMVVGAIIGLLVSLICSGIGYSVLYGLKVTPYRRYGTINSVQAATGAIGGLILGAPCGLLLAAVYHGVDDLVDAILYIFLGVMTLAIGAAGDVVGVLVLGGRLEGTLSVGNAARSGVVGEAFLLGMIAVIGLVSWALSRTLCT